MAETYPGSFKMIDNYVYLYHTDTLLIVPEYADSVTDTIQVDYQTSTALTRTAPIYSYSNSGPRSMQVSFNLHRDLMKDINSGIAGTPVLTADGRDYVDIFIDQIQAAALPSYQSPAKMVNPPLVAVRLGSDIFIKGVVRGSVGVTYKYPIIPGTIPSGNNTYKEDLSKHRYSNVDVTFSIEETDPYDAETVMQMGSFRGLSTTLERVINGHLGI